MGYVVAHLLEAELGIRPRVGPAGHEANHEALLRGDLDLYIEYTGTALRRLLQLDLVPPRLVFSVVREAVGRRWPVEWLPPFGFNNSYALLMRRGHAAVLGVRTCADLALHAASLTLGAVGAVVDSDADLRFAPGGVNGLKRVYGLTFRDYRRLPSGYGEGHRTLAEEGVDVLVDFPVHPAVHQHDLVELTDNRDFFGAYQAAPVVRRDFLERYPGAREVIGRLAGRLDNRTMARLNFAVEVEGLPSAAVALAWLQEARVLDPVRGREA